MAAGVRRQRVGISWLPPEHGLEFPIERGATLWPKGEGMPTEIVFVAEEAPEGGYTARALGFSIFTKAETIEALHASVRDAVLVHFDEAERPRVIRLHFVRDQLIAV